MTKITAAAFVPSDIKKGVFDETWICGIRYKGKYSDIGKYFSKLMKKQSGLSKEKLCVFIMILNTRMRMRTLKSV